MDNYSMNIGSQGVEQDRSCDVMGYDNVSQYVARTNGSMSTVPYEKPKPTAAESIESSNTIKLPVPDGTPRY